jgi:hypothetical protein
MHTHLHDQQAPMTTTCVNQTEKMYAQEHHDVMPKLKKLPDFSPVPSFGSNCQTNASVIRHYCVRRNPTKCLMHKNEPLLPTRGNIHQNLSDVNGDTNIECKTLWFSGIHELNSCGYKRFYASALNSALLNARDIFQPVIMIGRNGLPNQNSTEKTKFEVWAEQRGVIVVRVPRLSFQEHVDKRFKDHLSHHGAFLRLEIPRIVQELRLLEMSNTCQNLALYTDVDVLFPNKITQNDIQILTNQLASTHGAYIMYGREYSKDPEIFNTGVMLFDIQKFGAVVPKILELAERKDYITFDQGMINNYFTQDEYLMKE